MKAIQTFIKQRCKETNKKIMKSDHSFKFFCNLYSTKNLEILQMDHGFHKNMMQLNCFKHW